MILYGYRCPSCGYFEAKAKLEDVLIPCLQCGPTARRAPSVPAVFTESAGNQLSGKPFREK